MTSLCVLRAHVGCAQMRASQILTEKSINEKLKTLHYGKRHENGNFKICSYLFFYVRLL